MKANGAERQRDAVCELTRLLARALVALAKRGGADEANRLAARAWWLLRDEHPHDAERVNALMHGLVRLLPTDNDQRSTT